MWDATQFANRERRPAGDAVHCGEGVKCDETSVVADKSRGFVTGTAFRGYCVRGNLPEMPYPLTELVKAFPAVVVAAGR